MAEKMAKHRKKWVLEPDYDKPNWVSSQTNKSDHAVAPISFKNDGRQVFETLKNICRQRFSGCVEREQYPWLHVSVRTPWIGFVDDLIFFVDEQKKLVHVLSASRVGYYDFGANRKRVEKLRTWLQGT